MIRLVQAASSLRADDPLHHTVARRADLPPRSYLAPQEAWESAGST
ncbi:MAG: hypothetical protein QXQ57_07040 [Sulfolobales archaeon]